MQSLPFIEITKAVWRFFFANCLCDARDWIKIRCMTGGMLTWMLERTLFYIAHRSRDLYRHFIALGTRLRLNKWYGAVRIKRVCECECLRLKKQALALLGLSEKKRGFATTTLYCALRMHCSHILFWQTQRNQKCYSHQGITLKENSILLFKSIATILFHTYIREAANQYSYN